MKSLQGRLYIIRKRETCSVHQLPGIAKRLEEMNK